MTRVPGLAELAAVHAHERAGGEGLPVEVAGTPYALPVPGAAYPADPPEPGEPGEPGEQAGTGPDGTRRSAGAPGGAGAPPDPPEGIGGSSPEVADLSARQTQALAMLLAGSSITIAARSLAISRQTISTWLRQPAFRAAFEAQRAEVLSATMARLLALSTRAIEALEDCLGPDQPGDLRLRAALGALGLLGLQRARLEELPSVLPEGAEAVPAVLPREVQAHDERGRFTPRLEPVGPTRRTA